MLRNFILGASLMTTSAMSQGLIFTNQQNLPPLGAVSSVEECALRAKNAGYASYHILYQYYPNAVLLWCYGVPPKIEPGQGGGAGGSVLTVRVRLGFDVNDCKDEIELVSEAIKCAKTATGNEIRCRINPQLRQQVKSLACVEQLFQPISSPLFVPARTR